MALAASYTQVLSDPVVLVSILAAISVAFIAPNLLSYWALGKYPLNGGQYGSYPKRLMAFISHAEQMYGEGYGKFKNAVYRMTTADGERLIVPNTYLDELRQRPDSEINNAKALKMAIEGRYTGMSADSPFLNHVVKADLTRNLPRINPRLSEEVDRSVKTELPPCEDWTPIVINQALLRIVAIVSGHIFLGPELCRREEYLHASINYTVDVFKAVRALKKWPTVIRPFGAWFTPELASIKEHKQRAKEFLIPIIQERRAMMARGEEMPDDMLQWMLEKSVPGHNPTTETKMEDDAEMAFLQLTLSMAAIHTTSMTATHILYDIAAHPEIISDLRDEIKTVLKETDGVMSTHALFQMKLLDSVMRESQRVNPLSMARFARYVEKPITLRDGTNLPAGVVIEAPHVAITMDPEFYPEPEKFDPYRFYRIRTGEAADPIGYKNTEQYQFVTVTKENMGFGYGRHACPGRFFAANEIKLIMARLLLDYDVKMPEGQTARYKNLVVGPSVIPDPKREILLKRVTY
ncbi:cytochrome P450 [Diplogelasinospora grovesii]|uniref:Cytochrome P450 n=1 Tax=Diplogelasinospora grovesii TaxID=303347 RepID=A0AAN6S291_9PEZI|nr:cytochrome P450 [Diplogelasinospora grovesii]